VINPQSAIGNPQSEIPNPLFSDKINRQHEEHEADKVIPFQLFVFEKNQGERGEYHERHDLLNDFELHEREGAAVLSEADAIGRHYEAVFKKRDEPTGENEAEQAGFLKKFQFVEQQVAVPRERHKNVGQNEQADGVKSFHEQGVSSEG
jgi:hypothetical protein